MRKFVWSAPPCPRQVFTERLPELVQWHARVTNRLRYALPARASWLYVSQAVKLDEKENQQVTQIRMAHRDLDFATQSKKYDQLSGFDPDIDWREAEKRTFYGKW